MGPIVNDAILMQMCEEYVDTLKKFIELYEEVDFEQASDSQAFKDYIDGIDDMTRLLMGRIIFYEKYKA